MPCPNYKVGLRTHDSNTKVVGGTSLLILFAMQLCHVITTCRFTRPEHQVQGCWSQQLTQGRTKDTPLLHQSVWGTSLLILFAMQLCHVITTCRFTRPEHQVQGCWSQQLTQGRTKDTPLLHQSVWGTSLLILFAMQLCHVITTCRFTRPEHQAKGCWS